MYDGAGVSPIFLLGSFVSVAKHSVMCFPVSEMPIQTSILKSSSAYGAGRVTAPMAMASRSISRASCSYLGASFGFMGWMVSPR